MTLPVVLRLIALAAAATTAVVGLIAAFAGNPLIDYPWAVPAAVACIGIALALRYAAELVRTG